MTDEEIISLIEKHHLDLGLRPPPRLTDNGDGTCSFKPPEGLTYFGESLMALCRELTSRA